MTIVIALRFGDVIEIGFKNISIACLVDMTHPVICGVLYTGMRRNVRVGIGRTVVG